MSSNKLPGLVSRNNLDVVLGLGALHALVKCVELFAFFINRTSLYWGSCMAQTVFQMVWSFGLDTFADDVCSEHMWLFDTGTALYLVD